MAPSVGMVRVLLRLAILKIDFGVYLRGRRLGVKMW